MVPSSSARFLLSIAAAQPASWRWELQDPGSLGRVCLGSGDLRRLCRYGLPRVHMVEPIGKGSVLF